MKYNTGMRMFTIVITELPFLVYAVLRTVLLHLLNSQPLHDAVHVETGAL